MIIQVFFLNSMIFPCMELFLVIYQVLHDFQSVWEPCILQSLYNIPHFNMELDITCCSQIFLPWNFTEEL